jgi:hypothetical protein
MESPATGPRRGAASLLEAGEVRAYSLEVLVADPAGHWRHAGCGILRFGILGVCHDPRSRVAGIRSNMAQVRRAATALAVNGVAARAARRGERRIHLPGPARRAGRAPGHPRRSTARRCCSTVFIAVPAAASGHYDGQNREGAKRQDRPSFPEIKQQCGTLS